MAGRRVTSITSALAAGKAEADGRVERSLYMRAVGYSYDAEKIFCDKNGNVTKVPYREHVPPDVTACIFWLKNRDPARGGLACAPGGSHCRGSTPVRRHPRFG